MYDNTRQRLREQQGRVEYREGARVRVVIMILCEWKQLETGFWVLRWFCVGSAGYPPPVRLVRKVHPQCFQSSSCQMQAAYL